MVEAETAAPAAPTGTIDLTSLGNLIQAIVASEVGALESRLGAKLGLPSNGPAAPSAPNSTAIKTALLLNLFNTLNSFTGPFISKATADVQDLVEETQSFLSAKIAEHIKAPAAAAGSTPS